jgi:pimeloyl-ACP methyl ester carboxylesterase
MPSLRIDRDLEMHYQVDDYTDPWRTPEAILLLHGNHESGAAWYGWVPHLGRQYRVVRPDMRGFGASTPMPRDFPWTLDIILNDFARLMNALGIERFHLAGAKIGGVIARALAATYPERVRTLTIVGSPPPDRKFMDAPTLAAHLNEIEHHGLTPWARRSMEGRLGSAFPREGVEWWIRYMSRTARSTDLGFAATINNTCHPADDVTKIKCPTLVITTQGSTMASIAQTSDWQERIANSKLRVVPGDSFHAAVTDAERCAQATLEFIAAHSVSHH